MIEYLSFMSTPQVPIPIFSTPTIILYLIRLIISKFCKLYAYFVMQASDTVHEVLEDGNSAVNHEEIRENEED